MKHVAHVDLLDRSHIQTQSGYEMNVKARWLGGARQANGTLVLETYQSTSRMVLLSAAPRVVGLASQALRSTGWLTMMPMDGEAGRKWSRYLRVTERSCCFR